jgi:hypothetical protein
LDNKILDFKDANKLLADDLQESSATTIFSRSEAVVGRNAAAIRSKIADIEKERRDSNAAIGRLTLTIEGVKSVLRKRSRVIDELKGENRLNGEELERLRKIVDEFDAAHNDEMEAEDEQEDKAARKLRLDKALRDIDTVLTGISCRAAAAQPGIEHGKSTMNALRQEMGWMQQVINGALLADCTFIRQLGHDGGSIALCVSARSSPMKTTRTRSTCVWPRLSCLRESRPSTQWRLSNTQ